MSNPIRLVIFDCDGVLVDSERIAVRVDVVVLAELGWVMTEVEVVERFIGRTDEYMVSQIEAHLGRPLPANWEEPFQRLYRAAEDREAQSIAAHKADGIRGGLDVFEVDEDVGLGHLVRGAPYGVPHCTTAMPVGSR